MFWINLCFYIFSFFILTSAISIILTRNPIKAILLLIFAFFNTAALFILQGSEFVAMVIIIVYVGAVTILFLFVIMMIDPDIKTTKIQHKKYLLFASILTIVVIAEFLFVIYATPFANEGKLIAMYPNTEFTNTQYIGIALYTEYFPQFLMMGLILLVAMIGSIVLTLRHRSNIKRQDVYKQVSIKKEDVISVLKVPSKKDSS